MTTPTTDIDKGTIGSYATIEEATAAVQKLGDAGFPVEHVSIVTKNLESTTHVHGFVSAKDLAKSEAGFGAWVGGLFGLLGGAAFLIIPGAGPVLVAGSLAAALGGAVEGATGMAAFGAIIGAITGHFVEKKHIPKLVEELKAGRYILVAQSTDDADIARAQEILGEQAVDIS